jgi:hypothetical protein
MVEVTRSMAKSSSERSGTKLLVFQILDLTAVSQTSLSGSSERRPPPLGAKRYRRPAAVPTPLHFRLIAHVSHMEGRVVPIHGRPLLIPLAQEQPNG